jgi:hypothetical protein
VTRP